MYIQTVKSVIKEKRHGNYFNNMLVKNEEKKKKAWNIKNVEIKQYPQPLLIL